jgi:hypothetical protein
MPSPLKFLFRHRTQATAPAPDTAPCSARALQEQRFIKDLLERPSGGSEKPVDFHDLQRMHRTWKNAGKEGAVVTARNIQELGTRYLDWAAGRQERRHERKRPPDTKLDNHRRLAAAMVAQAEEALATSAPARTMRSSARTASPTRSRSPSPTPSSAGSARSSQSTPPAAGRLGNAAGAAVKSFRQQFNRPKPGSAKEFVRTFEAWVKKLNTQPFDEVEGLQVLQMGRSYLERHGDTVPRDSVERVRHKTAAIYTREADRLVQDNRFQRQMGIDTACARLHSPALAQRTNDRQRHAAGMVAQFPTLNTARDGTAARLIRRADGRPMYRFKPMPTRLAANHEDIGPQHAVLASSLHWKLVEQAGLDLRIPCATTAMIEGVAGVLEDVVDLPTPELTREKSKAAYPKAELQRAVLAQWVLGCPRSDWSAVGVDEQGLLRPRHLPQKALSPSRIAADGLKGVLPMINTAEPIDELHSPIDVDLTARLLHLDIDAIAKSMRSEQDFIDMRTYHHGILAGQAPRSLVASHKDAVDRLLEPLRALQSSLRKAMENRVVLPLAMVMADAAEELSQVGYP